MTDSYLSDLDVFAELDQLAGDSPEVKKVEAQEWLRLKLTELMIEARKRAGLTQTELAERMGVQQARVSKLENANYDRTVDSVASYLVALESELKLAVEQNGEVFSTLNDHWATQTEDYKTQPFHQQQGYFWSTEESEITVQGVSSISENLKIVEVV